VPVCTKCQIEKGDAEFSKETRKRNGLRSQCKVCRSRQNAARFKERPAEELTAIKRVWYHATIDTRREVDRERYRKNPARYEAKNKRWNAKNPDTVRGYKRAWTARNPEYLKAKGAAYYAANRGTEQARLKAWEAANPAKRAAISRKWRRANPDAVRAFYSHRRANEKRAVPKWETQAIQRERAWRVQHPDMTLDHIVPITPPKAATLGGRPLTSHAKKYFVGPLIPLVYGFHTESNWQPLTKSENSRKNNFDWPHAPWRSD
jgi:hypothetical protein